MILKLKRTPGLYLVGFMASGKSTVGRCLADALGWEFADLDDDIEAREKMKISAIFESRGETEFRRAEHQALAARVRRIEMGRPLVLALGGGAFAQENNRQLLAPNGVSIWLDAPFEIVAARVRENDDRPLARDAEAFRKLFDARREHYAKADLRVEMTGDDPMVAVGEILEMLKLA